MYKIIRIQERKYAVMNKLRTTQKLTLSAMFLAIGLILPFFTGQIQQIGNMLCPMHIPVLLCGFICGGSWGFTVGLVLPLLRSLLFTMPHMFPTAVCMAFELAIYGLVAGYLYQKLPKKIINLYISLICSMILGRLVWGAAMTVCMGITHTSFGLSAFWAGAVANAIPGIVLQIVLIPLIVMALARNRKRESL